MQIDRYLLRCCAQINPQRIIDTPAVNLCSRLVSILSICKKANGKRLFRTDKDVGGSIQKRVCLQTRSPRMYRTYILGRGCPWFYSVAMFLRRKNSSSERPRTGGILIRSEFCIKLVFSRHTRKYVGKKCTRMYTSGQAICKKANGKRLFRTDKDVGGSIQKRVCLQTRSPRMYRTYILGRGCPWFYTVSSFSFMKNSKFRNVQGRTFLNDGIPAAPCS